MNESPSNRSTDDERVMRVFGCGPATVRSSGAVATKKSFIRVGRPPQGVGATSGAGSSSSHAGGHGHEVHEACAQLAQPSPSCKRREGEGRGAQQKAQRRNDCLIGRGALILIDEEGTARAYVRGPGA